MHLKYGAASTSSFTIYEDFLRQATCVTVVLHYGAANCVSMWCILASRSRPLPMSCHRECNVLYYRSIYCATRQTLMDLAIVRLASPRPPEHWAASFLHRARSPATLLTWCWVPVTPIACKTSLYLSCHVLCGLLLRLLPISGVQFIAKLTALGVHVRWIFARTNTSRGSFTNIRVETETNDSVDQKP